MLKYWNDVFKVTCKFFYIFVRYIHPINHYTNILKPIIPLFHYSNIPVGSIYTPYNFLTQYRSIAISDVISTSLNFESIFFKELREKVMSIQMLAQELYRLLQEVEKIENQLENAPAEKKEKIKDKLRKISAERNRIRAALDGRIDRQSKHHIK
jgi:hypothetical protein